jgi:hypothetical protein
MNRAIIIVGAGLFLSATTPSLPASALMPVAPLATTATTDEAVTPVRWGHCYRCHHYGWYRGRHYGWYRHRHHYWR